jgi:hypothetical protein
MKSRIPALLTAALGAACLALGSSAVAYPDAKVEAQLRPDFGLLLHPRIHRHHFHSGWRQGCGFYCESGRQDGDDHGPIFDGPLRTSALVDCEDPYQRNHINDVIAHVAPGGVVVVRGGAECVGPIYIDHPITLEGQGGRPFEHNLPLRPEDLSDQFSGGAVIVNRGAVDPNQFSRGHRNERPDLTCIIVDLRSHLPKKDQSEVVLRNLTLRSAANTSESCLQIESGVVRLQEVYVDYAGSGSAIYVGPEAALKSGQEGRRSDYATQTLRQDVVVHALHAEAAIDVEGAISLHDAEVIGGRVGLNFEGDERNVEEPNEVSGSIFMLPLEQRSAPTFEPGSGGIVAQGRIGGKLAVRNSFICGYGVGAYIAGPNTLTLHDNFICGSGKGISAAGGMFNAVHNSILATHIGIEFGAGTSLKTSQNYFYGMQYPFYVQPGGHAAGVTGDNEIFTGGRISNEPRDGHCRWLPIEDKIYFRDEHRRPKWKSWRHMYYLPHWKSGMGLCRDPQEFNSIYPPFLVRGPDGDISLEEYFYGSDASRAYTFDNWPEQLQRVPEPFDHFEWDHPEYYHDAPHRWWN